MWYGIALEEVCRYDALRNSILGLCREHTDHIDTTLTSIETIKAIEKALYETETCCHGKDGTVVAVAAIAGAQHYTPIPVLLSPSCKTEKGSELGGWLQTFLEVYKTHPYGETTHGAIWTLASDGESSFRAARFALCMSEQLDLSSGLGMRLCSLQGLNLQTGPHGILGTCDPKHVMKRFATLLRNPIGIQVNDTTITSSQIASNIQSLPGMTKEKVRDHRRKAVVFIGKCLGFFYLSAYVHLTAMLHLKHGLAFLTGALYADSHAIVKDIIFTIARLQEIDPKIPYHIIHAGTDRLESIFSDVRTQDHSRNFDVLQLGQKLSILDGRCSSWGGRSWTRVGEREGRGDQAIGK
ncbi:hypothetical protein BD779DRAFT_1596146 [Infundibulicybe gibba]|nr:hypothetical protein BD779DRAFT_1596146 [Infundibulicybe gibba]